MAAPIFEGGELPEKAKNPERALCLVEETTQKSARTREKLQTSPRKVPLQRPGKTRKTRISAGFRTILAGFLQDA